MKNASKPALICAILSLSALLAAAGSAQAAYTRESIGAYDEQLNSGQIQEATINKRVRSIRVTLKDGRHVLAKYSPHEESKIHAELKSHHVPVSVLSPEQAKARQAKAPVHHKLRYIAGGIVIAVIVIVAAVIFYNRRRRD